VGFLSVTSTILTRPLSSMWVNEDMTYPFLFLANHENTKG
jgi:hypothetical protein